MNEPRNRLQDFAGSALVLLGSLLLASWFSNAARLNQLLGTSPDMGIASGILFVAAGLCLLTLPRCRRHALQTVASWALVIGPALYLIENAFDVQLGIDLPRMASAIVDGNPRPGRLSPNASIAFLAAGLCLLSIRLRRRGRGAVALQTLSVAAISVIGLAGLIGYFAKLENLYQLASFNRMFPTTAVGLTLIAMGLWTLLDRISADAQPRRLRGHERLITNRSIVVLTLVALGAGTAGFAVMRETFESSIADNMLLTVKTNASAMSTALEMNFEVTRLMTARTSIGEALSALDLADDDPATLVAARKAAESVLSGHITGIELRGLTSQARIVAGSLVGDKASMKNRLDTPGHDARLLWKDGYLLSTTTAVQRDGRPVGTVTIEQPLPVFDRVLAEMRSVTESTDALLCGLDDGSALCAPTRFYEKPLRIPMLTPGGRPNLPINLALMNRTGVATARDLRGVKVVAAYTSLSEAGLGLVLKTDVDTLYAPLKERVNTLLLALVALVGAGTWALRIRVRPLLAEVVREQQRTQFILDHSNDAFIALGADGRVTDWNVQAERSFGHLASEALGHPLGELIAPETEDGAAVDFTRFLQGENEQIVNRRIEVSARHRSGRRIPIEMSVAAFHGGRGFMATVFANDISERKAAQQRLAASEHRVRAIADNLPVLIAYIDRERRLTFANATFYQWVGIDPEGTLGRPIGEVIGAARYEPRRERMERALGGERVSFEITSQSSGRVATFSTTYLPDRAPDGTVAGIYTLSSDITSFKRIEEQLGLLARFDSLTGLANRHELGECLIAAIARSRRSLHPIAVMFLDIDHFKSINDTFGHAAGDAVLKEFAQRLKQNVRGTDTVARLSGDEFVIVLEGLHSSDEPQFVARKVIASIAQPFDIDHRTVDISTSIGIAYAARPDQPAPLLAMADHALYDAKSAGRATFRMAMG
jgi:diguanylate cyclase (GGDEF)-like protein/PAS domain S-box-containing protein